jgi:hypothetical protein
MCKASSRIIVIISTIPFVLSSLFGSIMMIEVSDSNNPFPLIDAEEERAGNFRSGSSFSGTITMTRPGLTIDFVSNATDIDKSKPDSISPIASPNPIEASGMAEVSVNYTDEIGIAEVSVEIEGPSLGLSNQNLTLPSIGTLPLSLVSGTAQNGTWSGIFSFPNESSDGNYLYSLKSADSLGNTYMNGPYSGIILDRYPAGGQESETKIISAVDGVGQNISNGGTTHSTNMTFTFEGTDKTGVALFVQCNMDDTIVYGEHGGEIGADINTPTTTYSTCFIADKIARQIIGNHEYVNLGVGNHTFKVRVIDNEYNIDSTPASFNWTILPASQAKIRR